MATGGIVTIDGIMGSMAEMVLMTFMATTDLVITDLVIIMCSILTIFMVAMDLVMEMATTITIGIMEVEILQVIIQKDILAQEGVDLRVQVQPEGLLVHG